MIDPSLNEESDLDTEMSESGNIEKILWPSPGQLLKELREELGISHEKVAEALYITVHYVKALEDDDYTKLPGQTFIKGYYKSYAGFLGTDTEQVMSHYSNFIESSSNQNIQGAQAEESKIRNKTVLWVAILIVSIGAIAGTFLMMGTTNAQLLLAGLEVIDE